MRKAILLSGGMDSIALSYWERPDFAITIDYGQAPANSELRASQTICDLLKIKHVVFRVDCKQLGSGDLLNLTALDIAPSSEWWPYRNQLLITLAAMKAISLGVKELIVGSVATDGSHTDGTKQFYDLINSLLVYQEGSITVSAPAIALSTVELVLMSGVPPEILLYAHSCHKNNVPCGHCRGCNKYRAVIKILYNEGWSQSGTT